MLGYVVGILIITVSTGAFSSESFTITCTLVDGTVNYKKVNRQGEVFQFRGGNKGDKCLVEKE